MQIHEITQVQEGLLGQARAVLSTPGALTSPGGYATAMNKYYTQQNAALDTKYDQQVAARQTGQVQQRAKQLTQQWLQQVQAQQATRGTTAVPEDAQSGAPTPAEQAKLQQRIAAASATQLPQQPQRGFGGLPGAKPPVGQAMPAPPAQNKTVMTGNRANQFKAWVDNQLVTQVPGSNKTITMSMVRQDPTTAQALAQLLPAIIQKNDPAAIEKYMTIGIQAIQRLVKQASQQAQRNKVVSANLGPGLLSTMMSPQTINAVKTLAQDSTNAEAIKRMFGLK
jgi:hypothetical protein